MGAEDFCCNALKSRIQSLKNNMQNQPERRQLTCPSPSAHMPAKQYHALYQLVQHRAHQTIYLECEYQVRVSPLLLREKQTQAAGHKKC